MTPLHCYRVYSSIKNHFKSKSYSIQKYGLAPGCFTQEQLESRNDKYFFERLAKEYDTDQKLSVLLSSNFVYNPDIWVGDLIYVASCKNNYLRMLSVIRALRHYVIEDTKKILSQKTFREALDSQEDIPYIVKSALSKDINPETVVVYNRLFRLFERINRSLESTHIIWEPIQQRFESFTNFVYISSTKELEAIRNDIRDLLELKQYETN